MRTWISDIVYHEGKSVELKGWIHNRRDHGKLIFIDLRDKSGMAQVVFLPNSKKLLEAANALRNEWVVRISGTVNRRPEKLVNLNIPTGAFEVVAEELAVFSQAETPPIAVDSDGRDIGEESRMKYRYLDLRRERMRRNVVGRHHVVHVIRNFLNEQGFVEIETPILGKSTPEGARDYLVPSRLHAGNMYALPQSPQQYKQLLMVAGLERYFQIARCFRDEDTRGDRQPEFTQLDLEMSFVEREDVMNLNEELLIEIVKKLYPEKVIQEIPFPRLSYKKVMEQYGTDRPDLRKDKNDPNLLAFAWVIDFPFFERVADRPPLVHPELVEGQKEQGTDSTGSSQTSLDVWTFTHNPFSAPKAEYMEDLLQKKNVGSILTSQYDIVLNGWEIGGGSIRNHTADALRAVFEVMGYSALRIEENFGHMLEAFSYGAPPHGGIAWGLDRLVMILQNEPNIREVIAFPKTGDGRDLLMGAPSEVDEDQLEELHLRVEGEPNS